MVPKLSALLFSRNIREAERKDTQFYFPSLLDFYHRRKLVKVSWQEPQRLWEVEGLPSVGISFEHDAVSS